MTRRPDLDQLLQADDKDREGGSQRKGGGNTPDEDAKKEDGSADEQKSQ